MKKLFIALLAFSSMACPGPTNPYPTDAQATDASDEKKIESVLSGDSWELTLPVTWVEQTPHGSTVLVAENSEVESLVLLSREEYAGTFDQFALESIRGFRGQESSIVSTSSTVLNGVPFVSVRTVNQGITVNTWLTVQNNYGYSLDCGGPVENIEKFSAECQKIAESFKLK